MRSIVMRQGRAGPRGKGGVIAAIMVGNECVGGTEAHEVRLHSGRLACCSVLQALSSSSREGPGSREKTEWRRIGGRDSDEEGRANCHFL